MWCGWLVLSVYRRFKMSKALFAGFFLLAVLGSALYRSGQWVARLHFVESLTVSYIWYPALNDLRFHTPRTGSMQLTWRSSAYS